MTIDRRIFLGGALAAAAAPAVGATIDTVVTGPKRQALDAIATYLEGHRRFFALPAMGLVINDNGQLSYISSGTRDYERQVPLARNDLWQIGSISKSFVALICLQLAQAGRIDLDGDIRKSLPEAPLPDGLFSIRAMLDHTTGLADGPPAFPADGSKLWRGFEPGAHWSYSNTAYELIGRMIERIEGKPLSAVIEARVMRPLGMADSRGGIFWRDRARYPASYTPERPDIPWKRAAALAPAPFGEKTFGAGCVAATLPDMAKYLAYLCGVGRGQGAPLLSDASAKLWLASPVVQDPKTPSETYGLGLMHRIDDGRALLHHTGGMVCFSSSFHVDGAAGIGAFASTALNYGPQYRPRLLTRFAVGAMRRAGAGLPVGTPPVLADGPTPPVPPADTTPVPAAFAARTGYYESDDPWVGNVRVEARGGRLLADGLALRDLGGDVWASADQAWSPERLRFGGLVDGKPMWLSFSGRVMERRDG